MFLSTLLKKRGQLYETEALRKQLLMAVMYLIVISQVEDVEVFKICLEYWGSLTEQLYKECPLDDRVVASSTIPMRRLIYEEMLSKLRYIMIGRMAKPEEVLVVENEQGEVVREFMKDTDSIQLYNNMRETLVYLTHLNSQDTENIMKEKLKKQGIPTAVHYPIPLNKQPAVANFNVNLPIGDAIAEKVMSLPMHPYLTLEEQKKVVQGFL